MTTFKELLNSHLVQNITTTSTMCRFWISTKYNVVINGNHLTISAHRFNVKDWGYKIDEVAILGGIIGIYLTKENSNEKN